MADEEKDKPKARQVSKFPLGWLERWRNYYLPLGVPCIVSNRWLQFAESGAGPYREGEYIRVDVMTNTGDTPRKICELVVTREDLLRAINNVKRPGGLHPIE
jgi:hypothetical protein